MYEDKIDVLICLASSDIARLFIYSIQSCISNFKLLGRIYIVTPIRDRALKQLQLSGISNKYFEIFSDNELLDDFLLNEDGWYKQQIIKLNAYTLCSTRYIACLSSDTILLQPIDGNDLFNNNYLPYIFFNNDLAITNHYLYEQDRAVHIAKILKISHIQLGKYIDFIIDFNIWDTRILKLLNGYIKEIYGQHPYSAISPGDCSTIESKKRFGEWTLYALFVMYVLKEHNYEIKGFNRYYFTQIHSVSDLSAFNYNTKIVHFVDKHLHLPEVISRCKVPLCDGKV